MTRSYKIESICDKDCLKSVTCMLHTNQTFYAHTEAQAKTLKSVHQVSNEMASIIITKL